jgi:hypothetical protein
MLQKMKFFEKIGPTTFGYIFGGVEAFPIMLLSFYIDDWARLFGAYGVAYILLGIAVILWVVLRFVMFRIRRKTAIIAGLAGWLATICFGFWYYCFGPGALGHSHF